MPDLGRALVGCVVSEHTKCSLVCGTVKILVREVNLVHIIGLHVLLGKSVLFFSVLMQSVGLNQTNPTAKPSVLTHRSNK